MSQERYFALRERLVSAHYTYNFGADSMDLIEKMFNDLVSTTESYKHLSEKEAVLANDLTLAQSQLFPLKKENSRLAKENYQLHADSIKEKDAVSKEKNEQAAHIVRLEEKLRDAGFLLKSKDDQLAAIETEKNRIKEAYELLTLPSSKERSQVRPSIRLSSALKGQDGTAEHQSLPIPPSIDTYSPDAKIIDVLREQLNQVTQALKASEDEKKALSGSLAYRDTELSRFVRNVGTGPADSNSGVASGSRLDQLIAADTANQRVIDQLNVQVDFLNEQLAARETQLADAVSKGSKASDLQMEVDMRSKQLAASKFQNDQLVAQLRALEAKYTQLTRAIDPDVEFDENDPDKSLLSEDVFSASFLSKSIEQQQQQQQHQRESRIAQQAVSSGVVGASKTAPVPSGREKLRDIKNVKEPVSSSAYTSTHPKSGISSSAVPEKRQSQTKVNVQSQSRREGITSSSVDKSNTSLLLGKLSTDRDGLLSEVDRLSETLSSVQSGDSVLKERVRRADDRIKELKAELTGAMENADSLNRSILNRDAAIASLTDQCRTLQSKLDAVLTKERDVTSRESQLLNQSQTVESQLVAVTRERDHFEDISAEMKRELSELKRAKVDWEDVEQSLRDRLNQALSNSTADKTALDKVNFELFNVQKKVSQLELSMEDAKMSIESEKRKSDSLTSRYAELKDILTKKESELVEAAAMIAQLKTRVGGGSTFEGAEAGMKPLRAKIEKVEAENISLESKCSDLERALATAHSQQQILKTQADSEAANNERLRSQLLQQEDERDRIKKEMMQKEAEFERSNKRFQELVEQYHQVSSTKQTVVDRFEDEHQHTEQLEAEIRLLKMRLQETSSALAAEREIKDEKSGNLGRTSDRLVRTEKELSQALEQNASLRRDVARADADVAVMRSQVESLSRKSNGDRADFKRVIEEKEAAEMKIVELRGLVSNIEITSRNTGYKCNKLEAALAEGENERKSMQAQNKKLQDEILLQKKAAENLNEALQNLDRERDQLQAQLDFETENKQTSDQKLRVHEAQLIQYRDLLQAAERKHQHSLHELATANRQIASLDARLNSCKEEILELKRKVAFKSTEVSGAAEDLMLMTKENQALTSELAEASYERDGMRRQIQELGEINAGLEHARRAIEIEKDDVVSAYRSVVGDMRKLEADLFAINEMKEKHGVAAQQLSSQVAELKDKLGSRGEADNRLATEKLSIARQLESTNEQLVQSHRRLDTVEADNRRLMQDLYGLRQTNHMLNERVAAIIKRAAAAGDANKILSSRLMNAERERDAIRSLLHAEQQRANELEGMTQQVRTESILREIQASRRAAGVASSSQSVSIGVAGEAFSMLSDDSAPDLVLGSTIRK